MNKSTGRAVTLDDFADRVECHFTTASRLRSGERLPGRRLLGRIVKEYDLDHEGALDAFTKGPDAFGDFLRQHVFHPDIDDGTGDQELDPASEN